METKQQFKFVDLDEVTPDLRATLEQLGRDACQEAAELEAQEIES